MARKAMLIRASVFTRSLPVGVRYRSKFRRRLAGRSAAEIDPNRPSFAATAIKGDGAGAIVNVAKPSTFLKASNRNRAIPIRHSPHAAAS
jgi:hypothetical protein